MKREKILHGLMDCRIINALNRLRRDFKYNKITTETQRHSFFGLKPRRGRNKEHTQL